MIAYHYWLAPHVGYPGDPNCDGNGAQRLLQLQDGLGCGTRCGSCVPALKRLIALVPATAALSC